MKTTIYTVNDCQFSKQEKEYLTSHQIQFEEKNLETNKEFLTEMLAVSNNFAGTPVTKIEKDDGQIVVLKGFTQADFDTALGIAPVTVQATPPSPFPSMPTPEPIVSPTPPMTPVPPPIQPVVEPVAPVVITPEPTVVDPQLNSILNNLQNQANLNPQPPVQPETVNPPTTPAPPVSPTIPAAPTTAEPNAAPMGAIPNVPDFQDK